MVDRGQKEGGEAGMSGGRGNCGEDGICERIVYEKVRGKPKNINLFKIPKHS